MKNNANHVPVLLPRSRKPAEENQGRQSFLQNLKAPLAACEPEKLRATLRATRLECKELEERHIAKKY